ncbi:hypothetical protein ASE41_20460 [Streptomyces sp. Root264]|nr:hypothetical protein ASE41_20460 [Streptomyces sp. Root264]
MFTMVASSTRRTASPTRARMASSCSWVTSPPEFRARAIWLRFEPIRVSARRASTSSRSS